MDLLEAAIPAIAVAIVVRSVLARRAGLGVVVGVMRDLGAEPTRTDGVTGDVRGATVSYNFQAPGRAASVHTYCRSVWPRSMAIFELDLRPKTVAARAGLQLGLAIDIGVGDPSFDAAFVVEAAPSELARELLDEKARAALLALHPCRLKMSGRELSFSKEGRVEEYSEVRRLIELSVRMWSRLEALPAEIQRRAAGAQHPERTPAARQGLFPATKGGAELARLETVRQRRADRITLMILLAVGLGLIAWAVAKRDG